MHLCIFLCFTSSAQAYDSEMAWPLYLQVDVENQEINKTNLVLNGREVAIQVELSNRTNKAQQIGFVAHTVFFTQLGDGETHQDKTFSELRVTLNDKPISPFKNERGYYLGLDITDKLKKVGLKPLPDNKASLVKIKKLPKLFGKRVTDWQGYISYTWGMSLHAESDNLINIFYRALPEFSIEDLTDNHLIQQISQHCGNAENTLRNIKTLSSSNQVIVERYEIPLGFIVNGSADIQILQPETNWLNSKPVVSLMCGIDNTTTNPAMLSGKINNINQPLSILIISLITPLNNGHNNDQ